MNYELINSLITNNKKAYGPIIYIYNVYVYTISVYICIFDDPHG